MITGKDIIQDGHKTLALKAEEINFPLNSELLKLSHDLIEYLENSLDDELAKKFNLRPGVGLAAPQVNKSVRMFAIFIPSEDESEDFKHIFINPKIISHSEQMTYLGSGEGCLSVNEKITGKVPRYKKITIEAYNIKGEKFVMKLKNFEATVFQHEFDHLNGILFTEKITENLENLIEI